MDFFLKKDVEDENLKMSFFSNTSEKKKREREKFTREDRS